LRTFPFEISGVTDIIALIIIHYDGVFQHRASRIEICGTVDDSLVANIFGIVAALAISLPTLAGCSIGRGTRGITRGLIALINTLICRVHSFAHVKRTVFKSIHCHQHLTSIHDGSTTAITKSASLRTFAGMIAKIIITSRTSPARVGGTFVGIGVATDVSRAFKEPTAFLELFSVSGFCAICRLEELYHDSVGGGIATQ
jgi:hypothetical protein